MMIDEFPSAIYKTARVGLEPDWLRIAESLKGQEKPFTGKHILVSGAAGFLGLNFLHFFSYLNSREPEAPATVVAATPDSEKYEC